MQGRGELRAQPTIGRWSGTDRTAPFGRWRRAARRGPAAQFPARLEDRLARGRRGAARLEDRLALGRGATRLKDGFARGRMGAVPLKDRLARGRKGDRGVASLEYLGMVPFLLLIALAGIQLGLVAYCGEQAGTAARTAARTAALPAPDGGRAAGRAAGEGAVSDWLTAHITWQDADPDAYTAEAKVDVPSVLPGVHLFGKVSRTATMPREDAP